MEAFFGFLARLVVLAMGCGMVLRASRLEAAGRLAEARRGARQGGFVAAVGSLLAAAGAAGLPARSGRMTAASAVLLLAAGGAALLAGLAGKPRPTGWLAAGLVGVAIVVALIALR
jgi:hypothetical protein